MITFYLTTLEDDKKMKLATVADENLAFSVGQYCEKIYFDKKRFLVTVKRPYKKEQTLY